MAFERHEKILLLKNMSTTAKSSIFKNIIFTNYLVESCERQVLQEIHDDSARCVPLKLQSDIKDYFDFAKFKNFDDSIICLIEDLIFLTYNCYKSYNQGKLDKTRLTIAILQFHKSQINTSIIKSITSSSLLNYALNIFESTDDSLNIQNFEDNLTSIRDILTQYHSLKHSVLFKKIHKLCLFAMSYSIFDKLGLKFETFGYTTFESEAIKHKHKSNKTDLIYVLCDSLLFLCERGYQILKTGDIQYLFHSSKTYTNLFDQVEELKRKATLLHNPEAFDFTESSFRDDLDTLSEKMTNIVKFSSTMNDIELKQTKSLLNDLLMLRFEMTTSRAAREHREAPYSILIFGDSGIGKSTIKDLLFYHFGKVNKLDTDKTFCYPRNPVAKYWDGFTTSQWCIILDDVAFMHPDKASNGDPSCMEFLQIINSVPFVPDQADLKDKGRTPLRAKLVIGTTNSENLNAHFYFSCASAAQRRFPYIVVPTVKKEFQDVNGMLDSSKTIDYDGLYPNYWIWTVKIVETLPAIAANVGRPAPIKVHSVYNDINDFLQWYTKSILNFKTNQARVTKSIQNIEDIKICHNCYFVEKLCKCEVQNQICMSILYTILLTIRSFAFGYFMTWLYSLLMICNIIGLKASYYICLSWLEGKIGINFISILNRYIMSKLGDKIHKHLGKHDKLIRIASSVSAILVSSYVLRLIYKMFNTITFDNIQNDKDIKLPIPLEKERTNVWYNDDYQLSAIDLTPEITSSNSMNRAQFIKLVERNVAHCTIDNNNGRRIKFKIFCIGSNNYITNNHNVPIMIEGNYTITCIFSQSKDGINSNYTFKLTESSIKRDVENDICILNLINLPVKKNLLKYIPKNIKTCKNNGFYLMRSQNGEVLEKNVVKISSTNVKFEDLPNYSGRSWKGIVTDPTEFGDCGSLLIAETGLGFMIIGLHVAGANLNVASIVINQDLIKPLIDTDKMVSQGYPKLSAPSVSRELQSLSPKSVFRFIGTGSAEVYGSFSGFRPTHKSSVCLTPMVSYLTNFDYKIKYGPPVMNGWQPWRIAAIDMVNINNNIDMEKLQICADQYYENIVRSLPQDALKTILMVYDTFTAINGAAGIAYVDKINRNTSAGNPWKKSKKYFLEAIPPQHGLEEPVKVSNEILDRVNDMLEQYSQGFRVHPNFCAHLKDEAVSFKKIQMGKTRVFTGAPFDWTIIVRKYFLSSIRLIQNYKFAFETAVGTNAQSVEWHHLLNYLEFDSIDSLSKHNDSINDKIAGDYKSFDKRMSACFILQAFNILIKLCKQSENFSETDLLIMHGIAHDTAFALIDFNGDLVQFFGSNPSGHPLTVIINSIVNSVYVRLAYLDSHPDGIISDFNDNVRFISYGDDNAMKSKVDWFNHTSIANNLAKYDITYTMADKEAESVPFLPMSQISFLKRNWVWNDELQTYLAPLDHESIEKMLMVWVRSKSISQEEQIMAVVNSAIREYFFYGRNIFEEKRILLYNMCKHLHLDNWFDGSSFPTWDDLVLTFKKNSNIIQPNRYQFIDK
jgi:hypothetical protein